MRPPGVGIVIFVALSLGSLVLLAWLVVDAWRRRGRFPSISYKYRPLNQSSICASWIALFVVSFLLGVSGILAFDLLSHSSGYDISRPEYLTEGETEVTRRFAPFTPPFYRYEITEVRDSRGSYQRFMSETVSIPWEFLVSFFLYWLLVIRWRGKPQIAEEPTVRAANLPGD